MAKKSYPSREERMKDLNQRLEQGIRDVFESERFRDYLSVMSRFTPIPPATSFSSTCSGPTPPV